MGDRRRRRGWPVRVLVTGAGGALGHDLVECMASGTGVEVVGASHADLDVSNRTAVIEALTGLRPDLVVHAAAWTAVDACQADPDKAFAVNTLGTRHLADGARRVGAHLCYVSTDYVFDGRSDRPYTEWDDPAPLSVYGRSKLGGERELDPGSTVVRTSWLSGRRGASFVRTVLGLATAGQPLRFVDDQRGCPTFTADLAVAVRALATDRRPGVFHVTNQGETTWYGLARAVLESAGMDPGRVEAIPTSALDPPRPAPRPANSVLDNAALRLCGLELLPAWEDSLGHLVEALAR